MPATLTKQELSKIALVSLRAARMIMECGGRAQVVAQSARNMVSALGAEFLGLRIGYASLAISVGNGDDMTTRMLVVGRHGVNHRLDQAVRALVARVEAEHMTTAQAEAELNRIKKETPKYAPWVVAIAVGIACASFGRLLGIDWQAYGPIFIASTLGQYLRHYLHDHQLNPCVVAAIIAFMAGLISGFGARALGSQTISLAMMGSILLLVPGVPATNAQTDIMDGHPTTGSARAVSVMMIMVFAAAGIWLAGSVLGITS